MTDAEHTGSTGLAPTHCPVVWVRNLPAANKSTPFSFVLESTSSPGEQRFFPVPCESEEATTYSCLFNFDPLKSSPFKECWGRISISESVLTVSSHVEHGGVME